MRLVHFLEEGSEASKRKSLKLLLKTLGPRRRMRFIVVVDLEGQHPYETREVRIRGDLGSFHRLCNKLMMKAGGEDLTFNERLEPSSSREGTWAGGPREPVADVDSQRGLWPPPNVRVVPLFYDWAEEALAPGTVDRSA